jgi:hypothetical protein
VVLVDQDQVAHATDVRCQTASIYEYEGRHVRFDQTLMFDRVFLLGKELKVLQANAALPSKPARKRLQSRSKNASKFEEL